ncbi:MAG: TlpA disulfide reductase family protein [Candidatus Omnitrophota bacterium]
MNKSRKKAVFLAVLLIAASWSLISCERTTDAVGSSDKASDFTLKDAQGENYNFHDNSSGKVVILNFWAVRCPACKVEIPNLVELYDEYRDSGLEVIGIDVDGSGVSAMKGAASRYDINYPLLTGSSSELGKIVASYGGFRYIPTTYIIDREGAVVDKVSGPRGKAYFEAAVKKLL